MHMPPLSLAQIEDAIRKLFAENNIERGDVIISLDTLLGEYVNERPTDDQEDE